MKEVINEYNEFISSVMKNGGIINSASKKIK